jgi:hypothetical protein
MLPIALRAQADLHRLNVLTDARLKNVCVLPKGPAGLTAQHLRLLPKTNEFFQVEIGELTEPEIVDITEERRGSNHTSHRTRIRADARIRSGMREAIGERPQTEKMDETCG